MSYNGSGTFNINSTGQPVVAGTVITASAFNALTTDLATGLTTAITKDGQTTTTAQIPFAQGLRSTLVTDSSSVSTGSIITDGGVGIAKNLYVGGTLNVTGGTSFTNPTINNIKMGYSTTATAGGSTSLTVSSNYRQFFTGTLAQTIVLPVTSTLVTGMAYEIENNSTGTLTVNSSGGNLVGTVPAGVCAHAVCIGTTLTTAADWDWDYISTSTITGTGANVLGTSPTITTPTISSLSSASATALTLQSAGTAAVTIDTSQNVGIGTASPLAILDVASSSNPAVRIRNTSTGGAGVWFVNSTSGTTTSDGSNVGIDSSQQLNLWNYENTATLFATNNTERMRITSGGYLKASDNASYLSSGGAYSEVNNSNASNPGFGIGVSNASFVSDGIFMSFSQRSSSSTFNAMQVFTSGGNTLYKLRGDGNAYADGTFNNNGADYAEYFESSNGQALTVGTTVVLDGNKIREATDQDDVKNIIGVVRPKEPSKASMIVGNTAWNKWANQYLSDDFDRYIMEDHDVVEWTDENGKTHTYESQSIPSGLAVPSNATRKTHDESGVKFQHYKINPDWNPDAEYVNRENRPEWNIIGLLGQVKLLKGKPVGDRWTKMRDVSSAVEEWFIR